MSTTSTTRRKATYPAARRIARLMHERHIGAVIVVKRPLDRIVPAGIITDRDGLRTVARTTGVDQRSMRRASSVALFFARVQATQPPAAWLYRAES